MSNIVFSAMNQTAVVHGRFTTAANGTVAGKSGPGYTVARQAEGQYRLTLDQQYSDVTSVVAMVLDDTGQQRVLRANVVSGTVVDIYADQTNQQESVQWQKAAVDGAAATATAELPFFRAPRALTVTGVYFLPDDALTANDTDYATLTVAKRDSAGDNAADVAVQTTETSGSDDWAALVAVPLVVDTDEDDLAAGDILTFEIEKAGSGVAVPAGVLVVEYTHDALTVQDLESGAVAFAIFAKDQT